MRRGLTDLGKGLFDRFRSLPIWPLAPFAGLMVGDVLRHLIAAAIILTIGLILGYRPEAGIPGVLAAFALLVAIGFGFGWIFIVLGLLIRTPTTVMTVGFSFLFPLVFASNIMVDPATMPGWLRALLGRWDYVCGRPQHPRKHLQDPEAVAACAAELAAAACKSGR